MITTNIPFDINDDTIFLSGVSLFLELDDQIIHEMTTKMKLCEFTKGEYLSELPTPLGAGSSPQSRE